MTTIADGAAIATAGMARTLFWMLGAVVVVIATATTLTRFNARRRPRRRDRHAVNPSQALYELLLAEQQTARPSTVNHSCTMTDPGEAASVIDTLAANGAITAETHAALIDVLTNPPCSPPATTPPDSESSPP